jgi:hypothetical protein
MNASAHSCTERSGAFAASPVIGLAGLAFGIIAAAQTLLADGCTFTGETTP